MNLSRAILIGALFALHALASAQILECVDANGKKTYTQICPGGTIVQRNIEAPVPVKPGPSGSASTPALQEQEKEFERRRAERLKAAAAAADQEKKSADDRLSCADDRRRLEALQTGKPSRRIDPDTGEHMALDEGERLAEIDRLQAHIQSLGDACL